MPDESKSSNQAKTTTITRSKTLKFEVRHAVPAEQTTIVSSMTGVSKHAHAVINKHKEHVEHMPLSEQRGAYLLRNSRMQIALLQQYFTESFADEEILELYPELTPADLDNARAFIVDLLG